MYPEQLLVHIQIYKLTDSLIMLYLVTPTQAPVTHDNRSAPYIQCVQININSDRKNWYLQRWIHKKCK